MTLQPKKCSKWNKPKMSELRTFRTLLLSLMPELNEHAHPKKAELELKFVPTLVWPF